MSKFLAFAEPCSSAEEAKEIVAMYRKEYFDARHVCWAYMIGPQRLEFRSNDDGEPSGTPAAVTIEGIKEIVRSKEANPLS